MTIKSRPLADGRVSWFLYLCPPLPDGTTLIPVEKYTRAEDRPLVEEFAKPYRAIIAKGTSVNVGETSDDWYDRFIKARTGKVTTARTDQKQWKKHIAPIIGPKPIKGVSPDDIEAVRDYLNTQIDT